MCVCVCNNEMRFHNHLTDCSGIVWCFKIFSVLHLYSFDVYYIENHLTWTWLVLNAKGKRKKPHSQRSINSQLLRWTWGQMKSTLSSSFSSGFWFDFGFGPSLKKINSHSMSYTLNSQDSWKCVTSFGNKLRFWAVHMNTNYLLKMHKNKMNTM